MRYLALALLVVPSALAQSYAIDKGSYLLGGAVGFSSLGGDLYGSDDRATTINVSPTFSYFVTPGLALGAEVSYARQSKGDFSLSTLGLGPNLAYYFGGPASTTYPFVSASALYTSLNTDSDFGGGDASGFGFGLAGGLAHMLARNVALTGSLFYQTQSFSEDGEDSVSGNILGFQGGVTAFIY